MAATFSKMTVHNGLSTSFWFDDWSELGCLMDKTDAGGPMNIGIRLHDTVATVLQKNRRRRHRIEIYNHIELEILKFKNRGIHNEEDIRLWKCGDEYKPSFTTKETWKILRGSQTQVDWYKGVWFQYSTPKFSFHTWVAILDRLPTGDRLSLWNSGVVVMCSLCKACPKTRSHLFFQCPYSEEVWPNLTRILFFYRLH